MKILPSFASHDVLEAPNIEKDMARLRKHLADLF